MKISEITPKPAAAAPSWEGPSTGQELKKDPWGSVRAPVVKAQAITGDPNNPGQEFNTLNYDQSQLNAMDRVKADQQNPELVKRKLNTVPLEKDEHGVGLTFGSQATKDAMDRKNRRQAYIDMQQGRETGVDWSQYSKEQIAQIQQDAQTSDANFGKALLDKMEKDTGVKSTVDRKLQQQTGGIVFGNPRDEYNRQLGAQNAKNRKPTGRFT